MLTSKKHSWAGWVLGAVLLVLYLFSLRGAPPLQASNISSSTGRYWAWNDMVGWIDFYVSNNGAFVTGERINRWGDIVSSTAAYFALDCSTLPPSASNDCATSNFGITNDGEGNLSGYAWSDEWGWISFDCNNNSGCGSSNYQVWIDGTGDFNNYAWNDIIGWISFNCANHSGCASSDYKVTTDWDAADPLPIPESYLESVTFDTESADGFVINSIYWKGSLPSGSTIGFQIAVASSTDFTGVEFRGPDGTVSDMYRATATNGDEAIVVNSEHHEPFTSGYRYFRYRVFLNKIATSPEVTRVSINWAK